MGEVTTFWNIAAAVFGSIVLFLENISHLLFIFLSGPTNPNSSSGQSLTLERTVMSSTLYENLFRVAPTGIAVHEPRTDQLGEVNQSYADALGFTQKELVGNTLDSIVAEGDRETLRQAIEAAFNGE
jgi:PAS domain-containing protein